jgi:hypothetical protein
VPEGAVAGVDHDLANLEWKGRSVAPAGADFQAIVSVVVAVVGQSKAQAWLMGPSPTPRSTATTWRSRPR